MFDGTSLIIIPFLTGVEGADMFNFFLSLVMAGGLMTLPVVLIAKLIQRA